MQIQTKIQIRPFTVADYDDMVRLHNANFAPEFEKEPADFRFDDEHQPDYIKWARWMAEVDGRIVGFCGYSQHAHIYHPRRFSLAIVVDPAFYLHGIGRTMYDHVLREVAAFGPERVDEWSREDMVCRTGFLERRGFVVAMRMWTSVLDLEAFDPAGFGTTTAPVQITTFAALGVGDERVRRNLYELWREVRGDVPLPAGQQRSETTYEEWWEQHNRPSLFPDAYFVALDGEQFVGLSQLWHAPASETLRTGLTATLRTHRRLGIARALKVAALTVAKRRGYRYVLTENEVNNTGMIAINDELGFVKRPAWVHYSKTF